MTWNPLLFDPARDMCPVCKWPLGNRSFAPPGGIAPCVADRYVVDDMLDELRRPIPIGGAA